MCGHKVFIQKHTKIFKNLNGHNLARQCSIIKIHVTSESVQKTESDSTKKIGVHKKLALGT